MEINAFALMQALIVTGKPWEWLLEDVKSEAFLLDLEDTQNRVFLNTGMRWIGNKPMSDAVEASTGPLVFLVEYPNMTQAIGFVPDGEGKNEAMQRMLRWAARWVGPWQGTVIGYFEEVDSEAMAQ